MSRDSDSRWSHSQSRLGLRPLGGLVGVAGIGLGTWVVAAAAPSVFGGCAAGLDCVGDLSLLLGSALIGAGALLVWNANVS